MNWIVTGLGGVLLYLIGEIVADLFVHAAAIATSPIRRPIWNAFMRARWPWPAALVAAFGIACSFAGTQLLQRPNASTWAQSVGLYLFLGGALVVLAAPALWLEARKRVASSESC